MPRENMVTRLLDVAPPETSVRPVEAPPRWPQRILDLAGVWRSARGADERERLFGELWTIVHFVLQRYARDAAHRFGPLDAEELRDIAADKSLELLGRLETGSWNPGASSPPELAAFLAGVARHGVVDRLRSRSRELRLILDAAAAEPLPDEPRWGPRPDTLEHARAIIACARVLTRKARRAWLLRVFYDFTSADIARHPDVDSTPAAVDAMLLRCRKVMRRCMRDKGLDPAAIPTGTFAMLWELVSAERAEEAP